MNLSIIFWLLLSYISGSINNAVVVSKLIHKKDIRDYGSNNSGTTNTLRTFGTGTALLVFALDILKPIVPILLARYFTPTAFDGLIGGVAWIGVMAIVGQCYPVFFGFRGGKGAASTLGTMIAVFPKTVPGAAIIFIAVALIGNMISLATLTAITLNIAMVYFFYPQYLIPYLVVVGLIFWRHRANIKRLLNNEEAKLFDRDKKKNKKDDNN